MRGERNEQNETFVIDIVVYNVRMYSSYFRQYMDGTNDDTRTSNE